jgi:hypothetical protein
MITKVLSMFVLKQHRLCQYPRCFIVNHNEIGFYNRNGVTLKALVKQDGAKETSGGMIINVSCFRSILKQINVKTKSIMINEDP